MRILKFGSTVVGVTFLLPVVAHGHTFTVIPGLDPSAVSAFDVTPDGQFVVGTSNGSVWIWSAAGGTQILTSPDWLHTFTAGVCNDGSLVVSSALNPDSGLAEPILVDSGTGVSTYLGALPGAMACDDSSASGHDISGDCSKVVGLAWEGCVATGFEWTSGGGMVSLGRPPGDFGSSRASAISHDGSVIVGFYEHPVNGCRRPVRWYAPGAPELFLGEETCGEATAATTDGSVIVGAAIPPAEIWERAFRYDTTSDTVTYLGTIHEWDERSMANGVSDNGVVVGWSGTTGPWGTLEAFILDAGGGMRSLKQELIDAGVTGLENYQLFSALQITPDGTTIVGQGLDPAFNYIAWVVSLRPCGDFDADNDNDAADEAAWHNCYTTYEPMSCELADCDGDGDVDCNDWSSFKRAWTGPPATPALFPACDVDCNGNMIADDLEEPDCNNNLVPDECDVDLGDPDGNGAVSADCNNNGVPDECEGDCNSNGVPDDCDLDPTDPDGNGAVSADCNHNSIPDECWMEINCDGDGVPDDCDLDPTDPDGDGVVATDCNANAIPDQCDWPNCNGNGFPDDCDLDPSDPDGNGEVSSDCQGNGIPDECETDCNSNAIPDDCDLTGATSPDCNGNDIPDECDIGGGASADCQPDGIPDDCQLGEVVANVFVNEPFDTIAWDNFPPAGWEHVMVGTCEYGGWSADAGDGHEAVPSAVHWGNYGNCDDYLISPVVNAAGASLTLWTDGCAGVYCDAIDVQILLVIGDVGDGDDILVGSLHDVWAAAGDPYDWNEGNWDLTPLVPGGSFRVGFRYVGENGESIAIDDVLIREILGPAPNDCNFNEIPDDCDADADGDTQPDNCDRCAADAANDADGDGFCESDEICDDDPLKQDPGPCGCGHPDVDSDGDGRLDCEDGIPTTSQWGLVIMALLLMIAYKVRFSAREAAV